MINVDRTPPTLSGDDKKDIRALSEYLFYLQERINYILKMQEEK